MAAAFAVASCCNADNTAVEVVPYPNDVEVKCGSFDVAGAEFHYEAALDSRSKAVVNAFAEQLSKVSGKESKVVEGTSGEGFSFVFAEELPAEAYVLDVTGKTAEVKASGLRGFNYAIQTIKQRLPVEIYG